MPFLDVLLQPVDRCEAGLAILTPERSFSRVLKKMSHQRVFVAELELADMTCELLFGAMDLQFQTK